MVRNLNKEISKIKGNAFKGLIVAANFILADTEKTPPLVPVETGNLRDSKTVKPNNNKTGVEFGFTAGYAAAVHFKDRARFKRPGSGPYFFSASINRNRQEVLNIIKNNVKL